MGQIAFAMGKKPTDFEKYAQILEDNFLDTIESLRDVTDEQWRDDLGFPVGLINKIKKELASADVPMAEPPKPQEAQQQ